MPEKQDEYEMLLDDKYDRLTIEPIMFKDVWHMYKKHEASIWHAHEVKLDKDSEDWHALEENERYFLKHVLAFFASSDMIVAENLVVRFMKEIKMIEACVFYGFQLVMENIHSEVYSNIIVVYVPDPTERDALLNAVTTVPCIKKKALWAKKWIDTNSSFAERLVAFAIVEGVFFSGAFCSIYWMNERGKLPGLSKANEFIARDEGLHVEFACLLYTNYVNNKLSPERFNEIMTNAVECEIEFITQALPCTLLGMSAESMIEYIKFVANRLAVQLGHDEIYPGASQPFPFMDRICLPKKSNFFEDDSASYKKFSVDAVKMTDEDAFADC